MYVFTRISETLIHINKATLLLISPNNSISKDGKHLKMDRRGIIMEEVQVGGREINYASQGNYLDPEGAYMHAVLVHVGLVLSIDNCMEGRQSHLSP